MPSLYPPRREPRVLAVSVLPGLIAYAVADPWEIRASGEVPCPSRSRFAAILRLVRREKPTMVVARGPVPAPALRRAARIAGVPVIRERPPPLPVPVGRDLYPELATLVAPKFHPLATLAIAAVLHAPHLPRSYVVPPHRRNAPPRRSR